MYESNEKLAVNLHELTSMLFIYIRVEKQPVIVSKKANKEIVEIVIKNIDDGVRDDEEGGENKGI